MLRPPPDSSKRALWAVIHQNAGRLAVLLAITNVFIGLSVAGEKGVWCALSPHACSGTQLMLVLAAPSSLTMGRFRKLDAVLYADNNNCDS